jgi:hypothetical protein
MTNTVVGHEDDEDSAEESSSDEGRPWLEEKPAKPGDGVYRVRTTAPEQRKAHKQEVKAARAEQRKTKVRKADKKLHRIVAKPKAKAAAATTTTTE